MAVFIAAKVLPSPGMVLVNTTTLSLGDNDSVRLVRIILKASSNSVVAFSLTTTLPNASTSSWLGISPNTGSCVNLSTSPRVRILYCNISNKYITPTGINTPNSNAANSIIGFLGCTLPSVHATSSVLALLAVAASANAFSSRF